jgi:predicted RNase H-like HicB family nuclease
MKHTFTAFIEWDEESKMYIGSVPAINGAFTQADTLDELNKNLKEVIGLCLEDMNNEEINDLSIFYGIINIEVVV